MATITLNKAPEKLSLWKTNIDFDIFLVELTEYMQDLEDIKLVKDEMKKNPESFDYDIIRKNYA